MGIFTYRVILRSLFAVVALFAVAAVPAQNLNVATANSSNNYVFMLNFPAPGTATATSENADHTSYSSIQSVAFIANASTFTLDLVVADNNSGNIAVYPNWPPQTPGTATATVIWTAAQGGAATPNGISVDGAGDLFVVNAGNTPQLWVFAVPGAGPGAGGCPAQSSPLPNYPALCTPVLVDNNFASGQKLVETTFVPGGVVNAGDLLLLTNNPATVLDYHCPTATTCTRIPNNPLITLPGTTTGGLAFWPLGNPVGTDNPLGYTLLITNQTAATILRYSWSSTPTKTVQDFFDGLGGNGHLLYKIKTAYQAGVPYAFVAESGSVSFVNQFAEGTQGPTGPGQLINTLDIHSGLNHPEGLAVANTAAAAADACTSGSGGCNPTGLLSHNVPTPHSSKLVETVCVVPIDPRVTYTGNTWGCSGAPLPVNTVCPGFDTTGNNMVIPGYMCGMSGDNPLTSGQPAGFTLIKTLTSDRGVNNQIIDNATDNVALEPPCFPAVGNNPTLATLLWAPISGEGNFLADGGTHNNMPNLETLELTSGCGTVHGTGSGNSLWGEGLAFNAAFFPGTVPQALAALVDNKYQDLETTIQSATYLANNITSSVATQLSSGNPPQGSSPPATMSGCVPLSQSYFDFAELESGSQQTQDFTIAADMLSNATDRSSNVITCDSIVTTSVTNNQNSFFENADGSPPFNPSGQVRSRLANLYFTINSRILGHQPNTAPPNSPEPVAWPPAPAPQAPPSGFTECNGEPPGLYPPPGGCPTLSLNNASSTGVVEGGSVTVSWKLFGSWQLGSTSCAVSNGGGDTFPWPAAVGPAPGSTKPLNANSQVVTATSTPGTYTYTLACTGPEPSSTTAQLTVWQPVVMSVSPSSVSAKKGPIAQVTWTPPAGATACTLTGNGHGTLGGNTTVSGPTTGTTAYLATYTAVATDVQTNAGIVTFTAACTAGASPGHAPLTVTK